QFGFQHRVEVGDLARGMPLGQALGAVVMSETQVACAINGDNEVALKAEIVQGFHADKTLGVLVQQLGEGGATHVPNKMVEGFGDRKGILCGARQEIEVVENRAFQVAQVAVGRTATAQAQAEEEQSPPAEKTAVVLDHRSEAGVG